MRKAARYSLFGMVLLAGGALLLTACSSGGPTAPTGFTSSKAIYTDTAVSDPADPATGFANAPVYVDGAPGVSGPEFGAPEVTTDGTGAFSVYLAPGAAEEVTYLVEVRDPANVDSVLWSRLVTVGTADNDNVTAVVEPEVEEESNGIGQCVSMCTKLYNPSSTVDPALLLPLMEGNKNGKFNAKPCTQFCKAEYRGSFPGDMNCNPFYNDWNGSSCSAPPEPEPPPAEDPPAEEPPPEGGEAA